MQSATIAPANEAEAGQICAQLRAFNRRAVGDFEFAPLWLVARDEAGALCGGLVGEVYLGWLFVDSLWVAEHARGGGVGSSLLQRAEAQALAMGAHSVFLDTFQWQAEPFYARHGYQVFGRLDDFPLGQARMFMRKTLTVANPRRSDVDDEATPA